MTSCCQVKSRISAAACFVRPAILADGVSACSRDWRFRQTATRGTGRPVVSERLVLHPGSCQAATQELSTLRLRRESRAEVSTVAWIIVLVVAIPMIGVLVWIVVAASLVRVPSGSLGLLMVKGRATDTALLPGPHFVPALRRKMVEIYPSVELTYRAGGPAAADGDALERSGPPLEVTLGDRTRATCSLHG